jgi:tetratricopeptide (TPR) repeat protein
MPYLLSVFALFFLLGHLTGAPPRERVDFYYGIAESQYLIGDLKAAESGIEQILRINSDHLPALRLKARIFLKGEDPTSALKVIEQAIDLNPESAEDRLLKALILNRLDRKTEADAVIEDVLLKADANSENARAAHQLIGLLQMREGRWEEAAAAFDSIYPAGSDKRPLSLQLRSELYQERAKAAIKAGDAEEALKAIDAALDVWNEATGRLRLDSVAELQLMRARLLARMGRINEAIETLQALTAQQPNHYEAIVTLAAFYTQTDQWDLLESLMGPLAERTELSDITLYLEGRIALAKNRVGLARSKFEAALEILPEEADRLRQSLYFYRGVCLEALDRKAEAETAIVQALDAGFSPERPEEAELAARILIRSDRAAEAVPLLEALTLTQLKPNAEVWSLLARAHMASNSPALALSALKESLRIDPRQVEELTLSGSLHRRIGDLLGALRDYGAALKLDPERPSIHYAIGLVNLQLGRIPEAEKALAIASKGLTDQGAPQLIHALLAYAVEQPNTAQASLQRYHDLNSEAPSPTAHYLSTLLGSKDGANLAADAVVRYLKNQSTRKETLDKTGIAKTPEEARKQICSAAFWMAQKAKKDGRRKDQKELLQIAVDTGHPDLSEWQIANWQLERLR